MNNLHISRSTLVALILSLVCSMNTYCQTNNILMFVSHENTYYSEYIVMKEGLEASGYSVEVRSSSEDPTTIYMIAQGGSDPATIDGVASALPGGGSYVQFTTQFQNLFGDIWDDGLNATPATIEVDGRIQDVVDMSSYDALIVVGGTGAMDYRVDGDYTAQGSVSAMEVQATAEKLNELALDALRNGKPIMAQCHGASLAPFWRVPDTTGPGAESIGFSILKGHFATGFPEDETAPTLTTLDVTHRTNDRVTVSSPHSSLDDDGNGDFKILTTRDWYPQTVAYATRTILNILETYPTRIELETETRVLILHGGAVTLGNCGAGNRANDIPCNFGEGEDLPADYTDIETLLNAGSINDEFNFIVSELDITGGGLPFDANDQDEIDSYLAQFQVVFFYKHWSTGITIDLQNAIVDFADQGGGVVALHHGLYNDIDGPRNKDILVNQLFGAQSSASGWSSTLTDYTVFNTNYGHFVSTYGVMLTDHAQQTPDSWDSNEIPSVANTGFSYYPTFDLYDEIYNNMSFVDGQVFGRGVNQITPIFSNDQTPSDQAHTTGFVKLFNPTGDTSIGRLAYFEIGERRENSNINHLYGQVIRNAVSWTAPKNNMILGVKLKRFSARLFEKEVILEWETSSEMNNDFFIIERSRDGLQWHQLIKTNGQGSITEDSYYTVRDTSPLEGLSYYRLKQVDFDGKNEVFDVISVNAPVLDKLIIYPNPTSDILHISGMATGRILIKNMNGKILKKVDSSKSIDISSFAAGLYVLQIEFHGEVRTQFFIKN